MQSSTHRSWYLNKLARILGGLAAVFTVLVFVRLSLTPTVFVSAQTDVSPITVSNLNATSSTDGKTETITGIAANYGTATTLKIGSATPGGDDPYNGTATIGPGGKFTFTITGLVPAQHYIYSIFDSLSKTVSEGNFFVTSDGKVGTTVTPGAVATPSDTSVSITGSGDPHGATTVAIYYQEDGSTGTPGEYHAPIDATTDAFSATIGSLKSGTRYVFWVKSEDGVSIAQLQRFTTTGTDNSGANTTAKMSAVPSGTYVEIRGEAYPKGFSTVAIYYQPNGWKGTPGVWHAGINSKYQFGANIGGLSPGTTYTYWLMTEGGDSLIGNQTFTTTGTAIKPGTTVGGVGIAQASAFFQTTGTTADMTVMVGGTYKDTSVVVKYGSAADKLTGSVYAQFDDKSMDNGVNGNVFRGYFSSLTPVTKYYYQVFGSDGTTKLMKDPASFVTSVGTTKDVYRFGVVLSVKTTDVTATEATISGTVALATNTLDIRIDTKGDGTYETSKTPSVGSDKTFKFKLTDLQPGHVYGYVLTKQGDPTVLLTYRQSFMTVSIGAAPYVVSVTDTTAKIAAKLTDGVQNPGVIYGVDDGHLSTTPTPLVKGSDGLYTADLSGLTASTAYNYQVVGKDKAGNIIQYTNSLSFLTDKPKDTTTYTVPEMQDATPVTPIIYKGLGIVTCKGGLDARGKHLCGFPQLVQMISNIIDFLIFLVAPIIATAVILIAGWLIMTAGGSAENLSKAKGMMLKAVIGLVIAMGAWIIVKFILVTLGYDDSVFAHFY